MCPKTLVFSRYIDGIVVFIKSENSHLKATEGSDLSYLKSAESIWKVLVAIAVWCNYFLAFTKNKIRSALIVKRTMMPAHTPALKIPAIAEHPATNTNKHANKNSNTGFIKQLLLNGTKNCAD